MSKDDIFKLNAGFVKEVSTSIVLHAPDALVGIISDDVGSIVVIASEVLKGRGVFNPCKNIWCYYFGCCSFIYIFG
jgi:malate/lactate dehydrogenase